MKTISKKNILSLEKFQIAKLNNLNSITGGGTTTTNTTTTNTTTNTTTDTWTTN